ncbi:MAG: LysR family transcriptional regulator [Pseudomonadota bacterium]|nr:LysR family transcriptional regulator [Pseudomonadota bacterium]
MKITLEQWQTLVAVVEAGGYARAAERMNKSQSAVSYSMSKMEERLGVAIFRIEGRKAVLTTAGQALYNQARLLLEKARFTEDIARNYQAGSESRIQLAMEVLFPEEILTRALFAFSEKYPYIRVELHETALSGTDEALRKGKAELAIIANESARFIGEFLMPVKLLAVAHPQHPLHLLGRTLTYDDLRCERQIVIRDSGTQQLDAGWLDAQKRWTVSTMSTSIHCTTSGLGFAWYPQVKIQRELDEGLLLPLPLERGGERLVDVYIALRDGSSAAPHVQYLAEVIRHTVSSECRRHKAQVAHS